MPQKQPKRKRLWLSHGSCVGLRPRHRNHVWSYDFMMDRTSDGRALKLLTIIDEYSRECLGINVGRKMASEQVLERLAQLFLELGTPARLRSDNGPQFVAKAVREWLRKAGVGTLYIEPGNPWRNAYLESFNGKLKDELLAREVFGTLLEAEVLVRAGEGTAKRHGRTAT